MKYFLLLLSFVFLFSTKSLCQIGSGTSILMLINKDTITIAADSRRIFTKLDGSKTIVTVKKIWNVGEIFFFMSGITVVVNLDKPNDTIFNASKAMYYFLSKEKDINKCFMKFNDSTVKKLHWVVKEAKNKSTYRNGLIFFQAGMAQMLSGKPNFKLYNYILDSVSAIIDAKEDSPPKGMAFPIFKGLGHYDVAFKYARQYLSESENDRDVLTKLIKLEIDAYPMSVGSPINVVSIYKNGHKWYPPYYYKP